MAKPSAGALLELAAWWAGLSGIGVCFVSTLDPAEIGVMVFSALAGSIGCVVARRAQSVRFARPDGTAAPALRSLASVVPDTARLFAVTVRKPARDEGLGHLRAVNLGRTEDEAGELTRRAVLTVALSIAPGSYVTGISEEGMAYVHELGGDAVRVMGGSQPRRRP